jgi:hypothetical protein
VPDHKPPPLALALLFAPFGVMLATYGLWVGRTGELPGRGGAKLTLVPPWDWIVGGGFIALGLAILATPAYYLFRAKPPSRP